MIGTATVSERLDDDERSCGAGTRGASKARHGSRPFPTTRYQGWARDDLTNRDPARTLPDADFAYLAWGEDGPNREGKMLRFRQLAVSRRAHAALIAGGLFPERAFLAVRSVSTPEPGVALLDEQYPKVPPMYSQEELADLRRREQELFAAGAR